MATATLPEVPAPIAASFATCQADHQAEAAKVAADGKAVADLNTAMAAVKALQAARTHTAQDVTGAASAKAAHLAALHAQIDAYFGTPAKS